MTNRSARRREALNQPIKQAGDRVKDKESPKPKVGKRKWFLAKMLTPKKKVSKRADLDLSRRAKK